MKHSKNHQTMEKFKQHLLDIGYLIPLEKEAAYLKKHNLQVRRFDNGLTMIGAQRYIPDRQNSSVTVHIKSGGYFDQKGKEGGHHLLEHLFFSGRLSSFLHKNFIDYDARTSQTSINVYNGGVYNLAYPEVGLLVGLPRTIQNINHPSGIKDKDVFEREKRVVLREIAERKGNFERTIFEAFYQALLKPDNPLASSPSGTEDSVMSITQNDLTEILDTYIGTRNMTISVLSNGKGGEMESLMAFLEQELFRFVREGKRTDIDFNVYSHIQSLQTNAPLRIPTDLHNGLASVFLVWLLPYGAYSKEVVALNFLMPYLQNTLFNIARERGMGYTIEFFNHHFMPATMMVSAFITVPKADEMDILPTFAEVVQQTLKEVGDNTELVEMLHLNKKYQLASPIGQSQRLESSVSTLVDFGLLTNNEAGRKIYASVTVDTLEKILSDIADAKPIQMVIGDVD